uniref:Transmembrane protein n=1 Tax=Dechloromonas aromatica (strain RCB) TaxID=159087 RepID=Q47BA2_DECAR
MIRNAVALWRGYVMLVRRLPQATGFMFAARSRWGRAFKVFLFAVGVVLPLGSLIWVLLFWHGNGVLGAYVSGLAGKPAAVHHAPSPLPATAD